MGWSLADGVAITSERKISSHKRMLIKVHLFFFRPWLKPEILAQKISTDNRLKASLYNVSSLGAEDEVNCRLIYEPRYDERSSSQIASNALYFHLFRLCIK